MVRPIVIGVGVGVRGSIGEGVVDVGLLAGAG